MVVDLLIGLPGERPGGLLLTILYFFISGLAGLAIGFAYAAVGVTMPRASLPLQAGTAFFRGIPLLLLIFLAAHAPGFSPGVAAVVGLTLYSFSHVGETLRSFLASYPRSRIEQARLMGISPAREWLQLRGPWTLWRAWAALVTHWVSLLKDTGALVILGVGELTFVAKVLSENPSGREQWGVVITAAGILYLLATLALVQCLGVAARKWEQLAPSEAER